jgi:hypothetical protein
MSIVKSKPGRPTVDEPRRNAFKVMLTDGELMQLQKMAKQWGCSGSQALRFCLAGKFPLKVKQ